MLLAGCREAELCLRPVLLLALSAQSLQARAGCACIAPLAKQFEAENPSSCRARWRRVLAAFVVLLRPGLGS